MSRGAPLPPYIKEQGGGAAGHRRHAGGVLLLPGVGLPSPFLVQLGEVEGEKERGGGRRPSLLVQFGLGGEGARGLPWQPLPLFLFHMGGGILLGLGSPSRTPHLARPLLGPASSSLAPLYTGAGGTPWTNLIYDILAMCGAPLHQITPR